MTAIAKLGHTWKLKLKSSISKGGVSKKIAPINPTVPANKPKKYKVVANPPKAL